MTRSTLPAVALDQDLSCAACGYNLRGLRRDGRCPECGGSIARSIEEAQRGVSLADLRAARRVCHCLLIACGGAIVVSLTGFSRPWLIVGLPVVGEVIAWVAGLASLWFAAPLLGRTSVGRKGLILASVTAISALGVVMFRLMLSPWFSISPALAAIAGLISATNLLSAPVPVLAVVDTLRRARSPPRWLAATAFGVVFATTLADLGCEIVIFREIQHMGAGLFALTTPHPGIGCAVIWPIATAVVIGRGFMSPIENGLLIGEIIARPAWIIALVMMSLTLTRRISRREAFAAGS
jgi:hypothetical protein